MCCNLCFRVDIFKDVRKWNTLILLPVVSASGFDCHLHREQSYAYGAYSYTVNSNAKLILMGKTSLYQFVAVLF